MAGITDFHAHIFPDKIAERAVSALEEAGRIKAYTRGTLAELVASQRAAGIERTVLMPVATKPEQVPSINDFAIACLAEPSVIPFGGVHPRFHGYREELVRIKEAGIIGVKFHPEYQEHFVDDEETYHVYEALDELGMIAFFHAGEDIGFETVHGSPERFAKVHDDFPGLIMVLAHSGGFMIWDEVREHIYGKDIWIETSFTYDYQPEPRAANFLSLIGEHRPDRILFGTDTPWKDQKDQLDKVVAAVGEGQFLDDLLCGNAERIISVVSR